MLPKSGLISGMVLILNVKHSSRYDAFFQQKNTEIFHISLQKNMLWDSLETPLQGVFNEYPQHMFCGDIRKMLCKYHLLSGTM